MPPVPDFHTGGFVFFVTNLFPQERNVKKQLCGVMRWNCVIGKPTVLFLLRNWNFVTDIIREAVITTCCVILRRRSSQSVITKCNWVIFVNRNLTRYKNEF